MMYISQCTITLTRACNLRCKFCYAKRTGYTVNDMMNYDDLKSIIDFCCSAVVKYVVFTGGEPTEYPHLLDILQYIRAKPHRIIPAMSTNGIRLKDYDYCRKLIDSGLEYIDVSMKGSSSQAFYQTTGVNGFDEQMKAVRNLSELKADFTCSMVITPESVKTFCEAVQLAHDNGAGKFSFTFMIDNEDSAEKDIAYLKKHNPFSLIEAFISQTNRLNAITNEWWIEYSFPLCVYTDEQLAILEGKLAAPCHIHIGNGITFDTDMNLLPCNMYIDSRILKFGKDFVSYKEFRAMILQKPYKSVFQELRQLPSVECESCIHLSSCYGGCPITWKNYSFEALKKFRLCNEHGT